MKKRATLSVLAVALSTACGHQYDEAELRQLNDELSTVTLDEAMTRRAHFAPLCDSRGYPLVGNINGKSLNSAQQFCAAIRTP